MILVENQKRNEEITESQKSSGLKHHILDPGGYICRFHFRQIFDKWRLGGEAFKPITIVQDDLPPQSSLHTRYIKITEN